jgi:hypothetical protein
MLLGPPLCSRSDRPAGKAPGFPGGESDQQTIRSPQSGAHGAPAHRSGHLPLGALRPICGQAPGCRSGVEPTTRPGSKIEPPEAGPGECSGTDVLPWGSGLGDLDPEKRRAQVSDLGFLVGVAGFEPTASSSRTKRATKLRHTPMA